jgi:hypothetical protein
MGVIIWNHTNAQKIDTQAALSKVRNDTRGVEAKEILVDAQAGPSSINIKMKVKNKSEKAKLHFVAIGNQEGYTTFFFYDEPVESGAERVITLGVQPEDFNNGRVNILAAGYSDGTYEGQQQPIRQVIEGREAKVSEYTQILAIIDAVLKMKSDDLMGEFRIRFDSLPPIATGTEPELRNHIRSTVAEKCDEYEARRAQGVAPTGREWLEIMRKWYGQDIK